MNLWHYNHLFLFLLLVFMSAKSNAQVLAMGHATAEVVELVGASAGMVTGFDLKNSPNEEYGTLKVSDLNLGTVTIHCGVNFSCAVIVQPVSLINEMGNGIEIETAFSARRKKEAPGTETLNLKAKAWTRSGQDSGTYRGSYEMVFAYN